jgi:plastocyanin
MQELWDRILDFIGQLVIPDWGGLVAIVPLALAAMVVLYLIWVGWRYATAGPRTRAIPPVPPAGPPGAHTPQPSFAPIILAGGVMAVFAAMVVGGGVAIALGLAALTLGLLYWGREAIADYLHIEPVATPTLPVPVHAGPPPGVHIPVPSFRPALGAYATFVIFLGLAIGPAADPETGDLTGWPALLIAGAIMLAIALIGWLGDFRREYRTTEAADHGEPHHEAAPSVPKGTIALFAAITLAAGCVQLGIIPPGGDGGSAAASPSPGASPSAAASEAPPADVTVVAENIAFVTPEVQVPADRPFKLAFQNNDEGVDHNVRIKDAGGAVVFDGEIFKGIAEKVYDVPALAAGSYPFDCKVHPNMTGTMTAGG